MIHATQERFPLSFDYSAVLVFYIIAAVTWERKALDFRLRGRRGTAPTTSLTVDIELQFFSGCTLVHNMCAGYGASDLGCMVKGFVKTV